VYRLEFLPKAMLDMVEITRYISHDLFNPAAAEKLAYKMVEAAERLVDFPYLYPVHQTVKPLKNEYRKLAVENYFMFCQVDERRKLITIARVIYARMDLTSQL